MPKKLIITISILISLPILIGSLFMFKKAPKKTISPTPPVSEEISLLNQLDKIVVLPSDEIPTIATVSDANKVKNQSFFARAENGDKVIVYTQAKKAILFRPSSGKLVEISNITIAPPASRSATIDTTPPK